MHWFKSYGNVNLGVGKEMDFAKGWWYDVEGPLPTGLHQLVYVSSLSQVRNSIRRLLGIKQEPRGNSNLVRTLDCAVKLFLEPPFGNTRRYSSLSNPSSSSCRELWPLAKAYFMPFGQKRCIFNKKNSFGYSVVCPFWKTILNCIITSIYKGPRTKTRRGRPRW